MNKLKLFAAALLIGTASLAQAQKTKDQEACADMAKAKAELLTKELALNDDQASKVKVLLTKNEENLVGMRGHCEVMDAKAKKEDEATYASINELLTPEQQKKMEVLKSSGKLDACGKEGKDGKACCAGKGRAAKDGPKKTDQPQSLRKAE